MRGDGLADPRGAQVRQVDLTGLPGAAGVVDELADALGGRPWALVASAGGARRSVPFLEQDRAGWRQDLALDLDGAFMTLQRGARRMLDGEGGRLVAITPVHETTPRVGAGAYAAAKHGLGGACVTGASHVVDGGMLATAATGASEPPDDSWRC